MYFGIRLLDTLTTALYDDPIVLFREYVQNSIDGPEGCNIGKNKEHINVDINIDKISKTITILDDGPGLDPSKFDNAMKSISNSKKGDKSVGFRGIGRFSGMSFCKNLIFESKVANNNVIKICNIDCEKYLELLNKNPDMDLKKAINDITMITEEKSEASSAHYFKVTLSEYKKTLEWILDLKSFINRLSELLPVDYSEKFKSAKLIKEKYKEIFEDDFDNYVCNVTVNDNKIFKKYTDDQIGESKIIYKVFSVPDKNSGKPVKAALTWFSFNTKMEANISWKNADIDGLMVRSKNMGMGDKKSLALYVLRGSNYVTTEREMKAALDGMSGEVLIKTNSLEDDAKREWFKPSEQSDLFVNAIADFLSKAHDFRYAASKYSNALIKKSNGKKSTDSEVQKAQENLIKAINEFTNTDSYSDKSPFVKRYIDKYGGEIKDKNIHNENAKNNDQQSKDDSDSKDTNKTTTGEKSVNSDEASEAVDENKVMTGFSDYDVPEEGSSYKRFYDDIMLLIQKFMNSNGYGVAFEDLRVYIRENYNGEKENGENPPGRT